MDTDTAPAPSADDDTRSRTDAAAALAYLSHAANRDLGDALAVRPRAAEIHGSYARLRDRELEHLLAEVVALVRRQATDPLRVVVGGLDLSFHVDVDATIRLGRELLA